jgi:hypothetical protein
MKRTRHTPEQIINKLREADAMLAAGKSIAEVVQHLAVVSGTPTPSFLGVADSDKACHCKVRTSMCEVAGAGRGAGGKRGPSASVLRTAGFPRSCHLRKTSLVLMRVVIKRRHHYHGAPAAGDGLSPGAGQRHPGNPDGEPGLQCPGAGDLDEGPGREHHRV